MKQKFSPSLVGTLVLFLLAAFGVLSSHAAGYEEAVQADGPIVYYRFSDSVAAPGQVTAANAGSLGTAADATYVGDATSGPEAPRPPAFPGFEADNTALQLDGDGDYVGTMMSLLNGRPDFTISGWIRRGGDQTARTGLFGQNDKVEFGYIDNDTLQAWTDNGLDVSPNPFPNGEWSHLALVGDGATMTMYTNGVAAASRGHVTQDDNAFPFNIGGGGIFDDGAMNGNFYLGQIDEVAVFDKPLSGDRIAAHYFSTVPSPPLIIRQPEPLTTVFVGQNVTLSVEVTGTAPFSYQWLDFGFPIDGETNAALEFENIQELQGSVYQVEVSNEFGSVTSEVAEIQVSPNFPPSILTQPVSLTRYVGGTAVLEVEATGSLNLQYQWQFDGVDIEGATSSTLTLTGLQPGDEGGYQVVVSNESGSVTSDEPFLTVLVPSPGTYEDIVVRAGPIAFWRLGETGTDVANDFVGGNNGTYVNVTQGVPGAITGDPDGAAEFDGVSSYVTTVPGLLNSRTEFTMTGWIKRGGPQGARIGLFGQNDYYEFGYIDDATIQGWPNALNIPNSFQDGDWAHLAVTISGGVSMIYTNGQLAGTGTFAQQNDNAFSFNIGGGGIFDTLEMNGNYFLGQIDDVAVFDRALTEAEIGAQAFTGIPSPPLITRQPEPLTTVFAGADVALSVEVIGTPPFTFQWLDFGFPIDGETNATLMFENIQELQGSLYQVEISNAQGSVVSEVGEIMVLPSSPPEITQDPQSLTRYAGATVSLEVVATGSVDLTYQWQLNESDIAGATESVLTLAGISAGDEGVYRAVVSNASGSTTSGDAVLTVLVPETGSYEEVVVSGSPIAYWRLNEESGDVAHDFAGGNDGTYVNVTRGVPGALDGSSDPAAEFDGSSSYVTTVSGLLNGLEDFSMSGWIKRNADQNNRTGLFGQDDKVEFGYINNDTIQAWTDSGLDVSPNPIPNGEWGHLALVGDGGVMRLYVNGQEAASRNYITQPDNPNAFNIGGGGIFDVISANGNYFNGAIDEVAVYDRALNADEVTAQFFTAMPSAPVITAQPEETDVFEGADVTLAVAAIGNQPLSYQWLKDDAEIPGATDPNLEFTNIQLGDSGTYSVRVTNPIGDTLSAGALVNVMPTTPPVITSHPQPVVRYEGLTATFRVEATGGLNLQYQWQANGADIPGETGPTLAGPATADLDGVRFRVIVSNSVGDTPSDEALLTVLTPEAGSYEAAVVGAGPIAYWRLNETSGDAAFDYAGDNHGTYTDVTRGVEGIVEGDGAASFNGSSSSVQTTPVLNGLEDFTMTGWIQRAADQNNRTGLFGQDNKVEFGYINNDTLQAWTDSGLDVSPNPFPNGEWAQVALVSDGGTLTMYTNGLAAASRTHVTQPDNDNSFNIGGGGIFDPNGNWFNGLIDEVAVFNRALSGSELLGLFELGIPPNRPPVCSDSLASTDEDASVIITLAASDPDNDPLAYAIVQGPSRGTAALNGNEVTYAPEADYFGPDSFTFMVSDPEGLASGVCTVSITVNPVNDPPVAVVEVSPLSDLGPTAPGLIMISPNNENVCAVLDGSGSFDIEGDAIESYVWLVDEVEVGSGPVIDACLLVGARQVTLLAYDGQDIGESSVWVEVLTGGEAAEELVMVVNDSVVERDNKRPFIATLKNAIAGFDRGSVGSALNRLSKAFINKVRAQIAKDNPDDAEDWIRIAREILDAYEREQNCDCPSDE